MISHGVISIAGGGVDEKDQRNRGLFFFLFFSFFFFYYYIFLVKEQEISWSGSNGENKTHKTKCTNKQNIRNKCLQQGSIPVPGQHMGAKLL